MTRHQNSFLPFGRQEIDDEDVAAVQAVLHNDFLTTGPLVDEFESKFAETVGSQYAIACSNGTAALHVASLALGIGPGDRVIVPSVTFLATANAIRVATAPQELARGGVTRVHLAADGLVLSLIHI